MRAQEFVTEWIIGNEQVGSYRVAIDSHLVQREGGRRPLVQDMVGDEEYPILYSIFKIPKQGE